MGGVLTQPDACTVRITDPQGKTLGTGFLVSADGRVVTCAHVIKGTEPRAAFPGSEPCPAQIMATDEVHDVTVLQVEGALPAGVEPARLGRSTDGRYRDFRSRGYRPLGGAEGIPAKGKVLDAVSECPGVQHKPLVLQTQHVRGGMSGAPVYVPDLDLVVGMVTGYWDSLMAQTGFSDRDTALATPSEAIVALRPDIHLHCPQAVEEYLEAIARFCRDLPYVSLRADVPLEEVYVRQQMCPKPVKDERHRTKEDEERARAWQAEMSRTRPMAMTEALEQHPRILLIGGPGAGKSTLLRHLVQQCAERRSDLRGGLDKGNRRGCPYISLLVSLRGLAEKSGDLATCLREQVKEELGKRLPRPLPEDFLENWPRQTGATWLIALDGLDEVVDTAHRRKLVRELTQAAWPARARVLITTRPDEAMSDNASLTPFEIFEILPFESAQVKEFAQRWFGDVERARAFLDALQSARLGELSSNPLLLTVGATVFEEAVKRPGPTEEIRLPVSLRRSALYGRFVDILLAEDAVSGRRMRAQFNEQFGTDLGEALFRHRHRVLEWIALAMQEGQEVQDALADQLLLRPFSRCDLDADQDAIDVLDILACQRTGLVTRRGGAYEFIHPTFREYLTAAYIVRESAQNSERVWRRAVCRWAEDNWREVALFALGILSDRGKNATTLIQRIWQKDYEGLYFAAAALAEQVSVEEGLCDCVVDSLLTAARSRGGWQAISALGELHGRPRVAEGLLALARDWPLEAEARDWALEAWVREKAVEALRKLGQSDKLLALARDGQVDEWVRGRAAEALGEMGRADELLALAREGHVEMWLRVKAAAALRRLGQVNGLLMLARDREVEAGVRERAAIALGQLGQVDDAAEAWLALACDEQVKAKVRKEAVAVLGKLGRMDELLALVHDEQVETWVHQQATQALGRFGRAYILSDLERIAGEDADRNVRQAARKAIEEIRRRGAGPV
jgi:hypothetical protein